MSQEQSKPTPRGEGGLSDGGGFPEGDGCTACPMCATRIPLTHQAAIGILINRAASLGARVVESERKLLALPANGASLEHASLTIRLDSDRGKRNRLEYLIAELRAVDAPTGEPK